MSEVVREPPKTSSLSKSHVREKLQKVVNSIRSMDTSKRRFNFLRQSSLAPGGKARNGLSKEESQKLLSAAQLDATLQLLFYASKGDVQGVQDMIAKKTTNVNAADFDQRTALHVAACENWIEVVKLLLENGAQVNAEDRWGSTPLADAQHYGNIEICKLLEANNGKLAKNARNSLMRISSALVPEYEINQSTLNFEPDTPIAKDKLYRVAIWQGTKVWVKFLTGNIASNEQFVRKFKDELALLLKLRHPNVVQFLGAVTQSSPMMIVTEFLSGGNLKTYMEKNQGRLEHPKALAFALDIARGMNYLHGHKPEAVVHRELKPSNLLLRDANGHIKVANFGLSHSMKGMENVEDSASVKTSGISGSFCRYMAPEIYNRQTYDKSVDVFSFGIILQEMMEGHKPFHDVANDVEVARMYVDHKRPPFRHGGRRYPLLLRELIEECWDREPSRRPDFNVIIKRLENIHGNTSWKSKFKAFLLAGRRK